MNRTSKEQKVVFDIQFDMLSNIISYIFTDNPLINRKSMMSLRKLFDIIDTRMYEADESMVARFYFIKEILKAKLDDGIFNYTLLIDGVRGGIHDDEIESIVEMLETTPELSTEEVRGINKWVSERLQNMHLFVYKDRILDAFESLQIGDYESINDINNEVENICGSMLSDLRKAKADQLDNQDFDLTDESFDAAIESAVSSLARPSNYIKTGIKYLNEMYVGGYESGRVYMYLGPSGGGKSVILLHSALWARTYNADRIQLKDPNKQPCVIFISMENSIKETIERIYNHHYNSDIRDVDPKVAVQMLKQAGLSLDSNGINIKIMYRPNKSISTDDLYSIIDEVEEEGFECICFVLDYVKRIRPASPTKDIRIDLGNVVDELTVLAKTREIPVITATQMNREAIKKIEDGLESGKSDIGKNLGASNVGESWNMVENVDYLTCIYKEYKQSNDTWYMCFKSLKTRAKVPTVSYFAHPFAENNQMHLLEDYDLKEPLSVKSIAETLATTENISMRGNRTSARTSANRSNITSLRNSVQDDSDDMDGLN